MVHYIQFYTEEYIMLYLMPDGTYQSFSSATEAQEAIRAYL